MSTLSSDLEIFTAKELFGDINNKIDFHLLDVRNEYDSKRFPLEGPSSIQTSNVPYVDFIEEENASLDKLPQEKPIKIICSREGSAKYVGEILLSRGFSDVSYLSGGISSWGKMLVPVKLNTNSDSFELYQFIRPSKGCLSYGVIFDGKMALIDPSNNLHFYSEFARSQNAIITQVVETHAHADHLSGGPQLCLKEEVVMMVHQSDFPNSPFNYRPLEDLEKFALCDNGPDIDLYHTPGHTEGSMTCLIDERYLITGDTLFIVSAGRPDLGGKVDAWAHDLYKTLIIKYTNFPGKAMVLPAHYASWEESDASLRFSVRLDELWKSNPIFKLYSESEFIQFIIENIRESPDVYFDIKKVNRGLICITEQEADIMDIGKNECAVSYHDTD